jgi:hypothetical protein
VFAGSTVDGARYDIISIVGKRVTPVTSRSVDAIGAGVDLQVVPDAVDGSSTGT